MMRMNNIKNTITACLCAIAITFSLQSCIENDIPYPAIKLGITNLMAEGQIGKAIISNDDQTVTINLDETVDIKNVLINSIEVTEGAGCTLFPGDYIDLSRSDRKSVV